MDEKSYREVGRLVRCFNKMIRNAITYKGKAEKRGRKETLKLISLMPELLNAKSNLYKNKNIISLMQILPNSFRCQENYLPKPDFEKQLKSILMFLQLFPKANIRGEDLPTGMKLC